MKLQSWIIICVISTAPLARADVDPKRIDDSIASAKKFIYAQQKNDNWEQNFQYHGDQSTGLTALAVYALLASGESPQDARIQKAVDYLQKTDATGVYALGVRCQVWLLLPQSPQVKRAMNKDARILQSSVITQGEGRGFYAYNPGGKTWSHSRGQYAVLGLWAASQAGVEVPDSYWQMIEKAWIKTQDASGGWSYRNEPTDQYPLTPDMTAVGIATLFITQDFLHADDGAAPRGNLNNPNIDRGIKWIINNFDKVASDEKSVRDYPYSTMYGLERIGVASGLRYFDTIDWFDKGADYLLKRQRPDGSWPTELGSNVTSTCFSVLFLSRGRAPLAMSKLDYSVAGAKKLPWNERPRDVANVSRFIGKQLEKEINWQIVNLSAPVEDWRDAPILYLSGNDALALDDPAKKKIKQFIEEGGIVVGNADGDSRGFGVTFRKLGQELFPAYEFRELPADHVLYTDEQFHRASWHIKLSTQGLSNGVRELMLLPQNDLARVWQTQSLAGHEEQWQLASNIFVYGTESKNLHKRGETYLVKRDEKIKADRTIKMARLSYTGNWNPEPDGWRRLGDLMHNDRKIDLDIQTVDVASGSLDGIKIAHLCGTDKIKFDAGSELKLKNFVEGGGTLIIDSAGGSSDFATAIEKELTTIFPGKDLTALPRDHAIFSAGGSAMKSFKYRAFASHMLGELKDEPRLKAMDFNGRLGVIYSREDLSAALVGETMDGIIGYEPQAASEMMSRILVYVGGGK
jgi:hypothetical protein